MDIAQFKEIIQLIQGLGVEAKSAFIWYLVIMNASTYLFGAIWSGISVYIVKMVVELVRSYISGETLRKAAGVSYEWNKYELENACKILRENRDKI